MKVNYNINVQKYFQENAKAFDAIYSGRKCWFMRFIDNLLRKDIRDRFMLVMQEAADLSGKTVLDIGCGSGRYSVALAKKSAAGVIGLDFSENMVRLAESLAIKHGVGRVCKFIKQDFSMFKPESKFNLSIAMGVFDYIQEPKSSLLKMRSLTSEKMIVSFPRYSFLRATQRKIRYLLKGCQVYFYTQSSLDRLLRSCGFLKFSIVKLQGDWVAIMRA